MRFRATTAMFAALVPGMLGAQGFCTTGRFQPDFGWRTTECGWCKVYGSYLEYLDEPKIGGIVADGPGAGKLRERDAIVSVDGTPITSEVAWHRLRDARPGDTLRFTVRREGDLVQVLIVAASRCFEGNPAGRPAPSRDSAPQRFMLGNTSVEIDGRADSVTYDKQNGDIEVRVGRTVVRVHAKP